MQLKWSVSTVEKAKLFTDPNISSKKHRYRCQPGIGLISSTASWNWDFDLAGKLSFIIKLKSRKAWPRFKQWRTEPRVATHLKCRQWREAVCRRRPADGDLLCSWNPLRRQLPLNRAPGPPGTPTDCNKPIFHGTAKLLLPWRPLRLCTFFILALKHVSMCVSAPPIPLCFYLDDKESQFPAGSLPPFWITISQRIWIPILQLPLAWLRCELPRQQSSSRTLIHSCWG